MCGKRGLIPTACNIVSNRYDYTTLGINPCVGLDSEDVYLPGRSVSLCTNTFVRFASIPYMPKDHQYGECRPMGKVSLGMAGYSS
jgi:hypothetical protein